MVVGQKIEKLLLIQEDNSYISKSGRRFKKFLCLCDCGNKKWIFSDNIGKSTKSCGCLLKDSVSKRRNKGLEATKKTVEYRAWNCMKNRCYNPKNVSYKNYGGRGIIVCDEWLKSYESFLSYLGRKPHPTWSLDRIDPNKNYEIGNVRWASPQIQNQNKRKKN
jgi:hypothetical protein